MKARSHERVLTLKTGKIKSKDEALVVDCAILDLSAGGACLLVPLAADIPDTFDLSIDFSNANHSCNVIWKSKYRVGVSFHES